MSSPWLTIIGIGDNGLASLTPEAQAVLWQAETVVVGERLETVLQGGALPGLKRILNWGAGFRETLDEVLKLRGTPVTVLATGDPMHFGIGATLRRYVEPEEMLVLPSPSAFSLARGKARLAAAVGSADYPSTDVRLHISAGTSCRAPASWR